MNYAHELSKLTALVGQANAAPHQAKLADINTRLVTEQQALSRADQRREELIAELTAARAGKIDADALADQFRAGDVEVRTTRDIETIQADIAGVQEATKKIRWQIEDIETERRAARAGLAQAISQAVEKVEDAHLSRIDAAYAELVSCFVDSEVLRNAFALPLVGERLHGLREIINALVASDMTRNRTEHDASPAIAAAIDQHHELIRAADLRPVKSVMLRL